MKYSIKDFLSSKIALDVNEKDRPEFNRLMDEAGMKWGCGHDASKHDWFPCLAESKVLRWSRGPLPVVNFSDLLLYAPADFYAGRVGVRCETRAEYDALMRECEGKGLTWGSGNRPTATDYYADGRTYTVEDGGLMYCSGIECSHGGKKPPYCRGTCVHRNNVPFSTLYPAPAPKQPEPAPHPVKVGDRIRILRDRARSADVYKGDEFTVKTVYGIKGKIDVNFDPDWEFLAEDYEIIPPAPSPRIEITTDGRVTTATLYEDGKAVRTGTAKCGPEDTFDLENGAAWAFVRLFHGPEAKPVDYDTVHGLAKHIATMGRNISAMAEDIKEAVK